MKKTAFTCFPLFSLLIFVCFITPATSAASTEFFILHTNNTNGALENCLCPGKSYGSLEKRALWVREWLEEHPNTLILDAGDFLSATKNTLKDSIAFRVYELIPYDAVALGDQEFLRGVDFISGLMETSPLPFVSSNLSRPEIPNIHREIVVTRNGIRFGIFSVLDPEVFRFYPAEVSESVEVAPYEDILEELISGLRETVDVVILLSHFGIDQDRELAQRLEDIDIIVGGHTQTVLEEPEKVGNSIIVQAGKDGYYVGRLRLTFDDARQIESYHGDLVPMDIGLHNDSTVVAMIVEYNRLSRIRAAKRVERISPIPPSLLVATSKECLACHMDQFDHWATTGHARSFEMLKHEHKEKSPDCLACHTTGFGRDDGYLNYNITAGLKTVNCTECHYTSGRHLAEPDLGPTDSISEATCIRCHDQENSPDFEFASYVARIRHPVVVAQEEDQASVSGSSYDLHEVQNGETLWLLSKHYLGEGARWNEIFELNRDAIENPDMIYAGGFLKVPRESGGQ